MRNILSSLQQFIRRVLRRDPAEPQDPYAYVTAGLKRGPGGRSSAVSLEEPAPGRMLGLFGRRVPR